LDAITGSQIPSWGPESRADGFRALWQTQDAGEIAFKAEQHGLVVALRPMFGRCTRMGGERNAPHTAPIGAISLIPQGVDHWAAWGCRKETAYFALDPGRLVQVAADHFDRDTVDLRVSNRVTVDPVLLQLATLLKGELASGGPATELWTDSLATLVAIHLLRRYSAVEAKPRPTLRHALTPRALSRVLSLMHDRLAETVSVAELAAEARLSPSAFIRNFKAQTGATPHRHLVNLRVEKARALLLNSDLPLAEVALASGFTDQSHMTHVFRRTNNPTPGQLRR
jgi:AraC family transcriptional regulator